MILKGIYHSFSTTKRLLLLLFLILICFMVGNTIGLLGPVIFGAESLNDYESSQTVHALKFLQAWSSLGIFVFPPLLYAYLSNSSLSVENFSRQQLVLTVLIMFMTMPLINILSFWNESLHLPSFLQSLENWMRHAEAQAMQITEAFLRVDNWRGLLVNVLIIALIPAIGEELLFRGIIQKGLIKSWGNIHVAIWLTALLFSAMHLQFLGFFPRFLVGALLGYLFFWSGTIWMPIIAHFVNNATAVLLSFMIQKGSISEEIEELGTQPEQTSIIVICLLSLVLLLFLFKQISDRT